MQWRLKQRQEILKTVPFTVEELTLEDTRTGQEATHHYHRLTCTDWVNILPVTADGQAILIRQSRAGNLSDTLEIPGGMVDDGEKDMMMTALRELEEETGFTSRRVLSLGSISPNPAIMSNRLHMFLALNAEPNPSREHFPDDGEAIEVVAVPCTELDGLVRVGKINSALACLTIMLAGKYVSIQPSS